VGVQSANGQDHGPLRHRTHLPSIARTVPTEPRMAVQRLQRYSACMATVQIRDLPDDVHRTYRARAAAAGMSLQEYLRLELIEGARLQSPADIAAEMQAELAATGAAGYSQVSATALIRADREAR
jgi:antitoxin FitA